MSTTTMPVDIRDYIVPVGSNKISNGAEYSLILENNCDFIVSRRTPKTQRELVVLVSQSLFYIKDKKTDTSEPLTLANLKQFLKDLGKSISFDSLKWVKELEKGNAEWLFSLISDDALVDMCRHNVYHRLKDPAKVKEYWLYNNKLFMQIMDVFPEIIEDGKYITGLVFAFGLAAEFGTNEAMYFVDKFITSGIDNFLHTYKYLQPPDDQAMSKAISLVKKYKLNLRRFIDYVLFDLYSQGMSGIDGNFVREYEDFLEMQVKFYGCIKEKYPKHFLTDHAAITLKYNSMRYTKDCDNFKEQTQKYTHLEFEDKDYCIRLPKEAKDLVDEGINLSHCVKDYISRVANGECGILFLRHTKTPDESLITIQVTGDQIIQAQGDQRRMPNPLEMVFIRKWGKAKKLNIDRIIG